MMNEKCSKLFVTVAVVLVLLLVCRHGPFTGPSGALEIDSEHHVPCKQCDVWNNQISRTRALSHEDFIRQLYIETVKRTISGYALRTANQETGLFDEEDRFGGLDWPEYGFAMSGQLRLSMLQNALETVITEGVKGDVIECGVWRGGTSIFARAVIRAHNSDKIVHVADSFEGLPKARTSADSHMWNRLAYLRVSRARVQQNFERFELYDPDKVKFVVGFFNESMPKLRPTLGALSVLRLDGDMFESCFDVINNLYDRLSVGAGGFLIVDDWTGFPCRTAIQKFRRELGIDERIVTIDKLAVYWRKLKLVQYDPTEMNRKYITPILRLNAG